MNRIESTVIPDFVCPSCGYRMDHAMSTTGRHETPEPGDISMCFHCTEVLIFESKMTQRVLTPGEFLDLPLDMRGHILRARSMVNSRKSRANP